jgi:outer membrane protein assembly factor BamB
VWAAPGAAATGPVVAGGRLIVGTAAGALAAYQATSGALAWSADTGIAGSRPAVAGNRAYATGHCRAVAIATTTGLPVWTTGTCATDTGTRTLLSDLLVFAEDGGIYQAQDGALVAPAFGPGTIGGGLVFPSPLGTGPATLAARDAASFAPRWSWAPPLPGRMALRPAVTEGTVWQVVDTGADGLLLGALDAATGDERWTGFLPQAAGAALTPGVATAVAAVPGVLLVPTAGGKLSALHNVGAGPLGITATVPTNVVAAGSRTTVRGQLVSRTGGLVGPRTVLLEADTHPFDGRYDVAGHTVAGRSGFTFAVRVPRNTRFRLAADGVTYPPTPVYASPRLSVVYHRTKHKLVVRATLRIGAAKGLHRRGGRVAVYRRKRGGRVARRLGRGRASARGVAHFPVHIPPTLKRSDQVLTCLRGASRQGFGYPDVLDVHCGDRRIAIPKAAASSRQGTIWPRPSRLSSQSLNHAARSPRPLLG